MRYSKISPKTRRNDPKDAPSPGTRLLVRGGFAEQVTGGIWIMATLGLLARRQAERIVREEMNRAGAVEVEMPILHPKELWEKTGRWEKYLGAGIAFHLKDRKGADFILAPTAEEPMTSFARSSLTTYRDLPMTWWQMSPKFRDEFRPRQGLIRGREFVMKDAYSFDADEDGMRRSYHIMEEAYHNETIENFMQQTYKKIAVIGGGVMGTVLIRALIKIGLTKHILVCERNIVHRNQLRKINSQIQVTDNISDCADADIIFLAVKPQDFGNVRFKINERTLICSIMAGTSIAQISKQFKTKKVVRMMPNIAARVSEGFTAWTAASKVSAAEKKWIKNFLIKIGAELYVKKEEQIDKATAVTGSGPAYIFNTLSVFINAAEQLGFKPEEAHLMVRQVLRGASALADEDVDFAELTRQVTSKGGTTEAALGVFNNSDFKKIWTKAIGVAYKRARELSK